MPTSFSRQGCIPDVMFKWTHYAQAMIRAFSGCNYFDIKLEMAQAILQHYGWRSFFIDLSKSSAIACWFASNAYNESYSLHTSEDINENSVWLRHKDARYTEHESNGYIYVIDQSILSDLNVEIHDLTTIQEDEGRLRFNAQKACLAGNLENRMPPQAVVSHIEVSHAVLKAYHERHGILSVSDVFPPKDEDFILRTILNLPWEQIQIEDSPIPAFRRGLEIPDYEDNFVKNLPASVTLYEQYWISDHRNDLELDLHNALYFKLPQFAYYANTNQPFSLEYVDEVLEKLGSFVIELDGLIKIIEDDRHYLFEKGIHVVRDEQDCIKVSGLIISHPSNMVKAVGKNDGWVYRKKGAYWARIAHNDQCPCNNDLRHQLQFSLLRFLNEALKDEQLVVESDLCRRHKDIAVS